MSMMCVCEFRIYDDADCFRHINARTAPSPATGAHLNQCNCPRPTNQCGESYFCCHSLLSSCQNKNKPHILHARTRQSPRIHISIYHRSADCWPNVILNLRPRRVRWILAPRCDRVRRFYYWIFRRWPLCMDRRYSIVIDHNAYLWMLSASIKRADLILQFGASLAADLNLINAFHAHASDNGDMKREKNDECRINGL